MFVAEQKARDFRDTTISRQQTVDGDHGRIETRTTTVIHDVAWLQVGLIVRSHWAVENSLHGVMDMVFRDDERRVRTDHAPANLTTIKHMALNLLRNAKGKDSLRLRRKVAAGDDDFLANLIPA